MLHNFTNGINGLKKHVYVDIYVIEKTFEEEVNNLSKNPLRENLQKITSCKWNCYF